MNKPKHTPGPWTHHSLNDKNSKYSIVAWGPIAYVGDNGNGIENVEANAHLIAAAPELLEALEACLYFMEDITKECSITDPVNESKARAAIAKAKGE